MGVLDVVDGSGLFTYAVDQTAQMEDFAGRQLTTALEYFTEGRYEEAIRTFKRSIGLAPRSSTALNAYDYMARSYLVLDDSRAAIDTYRQSLRLEPGQPAVHLALGNIHFDNGDYDQAVTAYAEALRLDPSTSNRFSLGQALMEDGQLDDAERQFALVRQLSPREPDGDYGLGQVYARRGEYDEAIAAFQRAIDIQSDFWFAYEEMGFALADRGDYGLAQDLVTTLATPAPQMSITLNSYISQRQPPELFAVYSTSTFLYTLGPRTQVASIGDYLTDPNSQRTFTMVFQFSKSMDSLSVQNVNNWTISRSMDTGKGDGYNFSMTLPSTEITLPEHPSSVVYDEKEGSATVFFVLQQNATADGTLDPSHVKFTFSGVDAEGLAMSSQADEYTGFSGFA